MPHSNRLQCQVIFKEHDIYGFDWSPQSPDLNQTNNIVLPLEQRAMIKLDSLKNSERK